MSRALVAGVVAAGLLAGFASARSTPVVSAHGIADVRLGLARATAVAELSMMFGQPSRQFVDNGCGPRFREVAWGHLYVEFRSGRLSGFRYREDGWPPSRAGAQTVRSDLPRLTTVHGVTLGSTLHTARLAYGRLTTVGAGRRRTPDGLIFYGDAAGRIVEIKAATCGDF